MLIISIMQVMAPPSMAAGVLSVQQQQQQQYQQQFHPGVYGSVGGNMSVSSSVASLPRIGNGSNDADQRTMGNGRIPNGGPKMQASS